MAAEPQRDSRLPFEPHKKRQKPANNSKTPPEATKKAEQQAPKSPKLGKKTQVTTKKNQQTPQATNEQMAVPKVVSERMARRMAVFCGIPTALGMATFIASYQVVIHGWFKLPHIAVLLTSMGFFGLGVLGLTYGVLSASWDEDLAGSKLGWQEFKVNLERTVSDWRSNRQKNV